ncbi:MAG: type II secretion system protein [Phycisphaerales bacterium]
MTTTHDRADRKGDNDTVTRLRFNPDPTTNPAARAARGRSRGFTVVELLVVITIIVLLVSIGTVAATRMRANAEVTSTRFLMGSIKNGLTQFESDHGFYPPLLNDLDSDPELTPVDEFSVKRRMGFYSTLTLVPYLVGVGDLNKSGGDERDEFDDLYDDGVEGVGFRDPGPDRAWGYDYQGGDSASTREAYWKAKARATPDEKIKGEKFGPYIELGDEFQFVRAKDRDGDLYDLVLYQFVDYWGEPIRYYRDWSEIERETDEELVPLEWIGAFEPAEFESIRMTLRAAPYVLFSSGRDGQTDDGEFDAEVNEDNLLEIGE